MLRLGSIAIALTPPFALGLKVASAVPLVLFNRAILLRGRPPIFVKKPPTIGLPLLSIAIAWS